MEDNGIHFPDSNHTDGQAHVIPAEPQCRAADQPSAPGGGDTAYELRVLSFRGPPAQVSVAKRVGEEDAADRHRRRVDAPLKESRSFPLRRGYQAGAKTSCHLSLAEAAGQSQRGITVGQVWHVPGSTLVGLSACPKKAWQPLSRGVEEGPWASWSGVTASVDMLGSLVTR